MLHDEPHGQRHHAMGVAGFGQTILRGIRVKELVARAAPMLGIEQFDVAGSPRNQIPHVVEYPRARPIAIARLAALRTGERFEVPPAAHNLRLWELFGVANPRRGIRHILSRARHDNSLLGFASWT